MSLDDFIISPAEQLRRARERRARMYATPKPAHDPEPAVIEEVPALEPEVEELPPPRPLTYLERLRLVLPARALGYAKATEMNVRQPVEPPVKRMQAELMVCSRADLIAEVVAERFDISLEKLKGRRGSPRVSRARQIAMWITYNATKLSNSQIGRIYGRDHSTVVHAVREVTRLSEAPGEVGKNIRDIQEKCHEVLAAVHDATAPAKSWGVGDKSGDRFRHREVVYNEDGPGRCG